MNLNDREERQIAAAEYVLGGLDAGNSAAFEERLRSDTPLRELVDEWRARLAAAAAHEPPVPAPSTADPVPDRPQSSATADAPRLIQGSSGGAREETAGRSAVLLLQLQRRVEIWRMLAFAGAITAAGFGFFLFARSPAWQPEAELGEDVAGSAVEPAAEPLSPLPEALQSPGTR